MELNEKLSSAIFNVGRHIREKMHAECSADFTQGEIEVLKFLEGKKGITMRIIADYLHIKPSSTTPLIENLVKKGFLKRINDKTDRRIVYVIITPKGLKTLQKKYKTLHKTINKIFEKLSKKDKEDLIKIFSKI